MIFKQIGDILSGRKTQTRRVVKPSEHRERIAYLNGRVEIIVFGGFKGNGRKKWEVGGCYAVVPGRGKPSIGQRIRITGIRMERLHNITEADAIAEGVASVEEYETLWESINGKTKGARWQDNPEVWVLEFELAKELAVG